MKNPLYPTAYEESAYSLDYDKLYALGYRGILFDIDNTLVPHGADATQEADRLLDAVQRAGFRVLLLTDNGEGRIRRFLGDKSLPYIGNAGKPRPHSFRKAVQMLGLKRSEVLVIGDQLFLDILGANLSGLASILVKYIGYYDEGNKGKRRALEAKVLAHYTKSRAANRLGSITKEEANIR